MLLTISKRFHFCASRRLAVPRWDAARNRAYFGPEADARFGSGRNYEAVLVFRGEVDPRTGMVVNVAEIKARVNDLLAGRYDHKLFNQDTPPFGEVVPTPENVAVQLLDDVRPLFRSFRAQPVACHLIESTGREATAYHDGTVEGHHWLEWSAARRTLSPHLSATENEALFGPAVRAHGHHYRLRLTLAGDRDPDTGLPAEPDAVRAALAALHAQLDHRLLNDEVIALADRPMTTESLVRWLHHELAAGLPVARTRLWERPDFFAEHGQPGDTRLGMVRTFDASHRLHSPHLDDVENHQVYERCNNPSGHGHTYRAEATLAAPYDERSGTVGDFVALQDGLEAALSPWQDRHLDWETGDFNDRPSTSENILQVLWPRLEGNWRGQLSRLRLWETANNRFALRRKAESGVLAAP